MSLDDIIAKLPKEFQDIATTYAPLFLESAEDELTAWIKLIAKGKWLDAYKVATKQMTTEQLINEQQRINEKLKELNVKNARDITRQKQLIEDALMAGLLLLKAGLI